MTTPKPEFIDFIHKASQMWCDKRVEDREMDVVFAQVVAEALSEAYSAGRASVLEKWPSRDEMNREIEKREIDKQDEFIFEDVGFVRCYEWLRERLGVNK